MPYRRMTKVILVFVQTYFWRPLGYPTRQSMRPVGQLGYRLADPLVLIDDHQISWEARRVAVNTVDPENRGGVSADRLYISNTPSLSLSQHHRKVVLVPEDHDHSRPSPEGGQTGLLYVLDDGSLPDVMTSGRGRSLGCRRWESCRSCRSWDSCCSCRSRGLRS